MKRIAVPAFVLVFLSACTYSNKEVDFPVNTTCDTTNVSFNGYVRPLFAAKCNSCHGGNGSLGGGIVLDNYVDVKDFLDNTGNTMMNALLQNGLSEAMPRGGEPKLPDCDIAKIHAWINAGAPNN